MYTNPFSTMIADPYSTDEETNGIDPFFLENDDDRGSDVSTDVED